jgi:hypothetical protein
MEAVNSSAAAATVCRPLLASAAAEATALIRRGGHRLCGGFQLGGTRGEHPDQMTDLALEFVRHPMQGGFLLVCGLTLGLILRRPKPLGLRHMILEYQRRGRHSADLVTPASARDDSREIAFRQSTHGASQIAERGRDVAADEPGGKHSKNQDQSADGRQMPQRGVEIGVDVVRIGTGQNHRVPRCKARHIRHFEQRYGFPGFGEYIGDDTAFMAGDGLTDDVVQQPAVAVLGSRRLALATRVGAMG